MDGEKMIITVPASSANLGPGFDSIGLAVNRYLTLEVERAQEWRFYSDSDELLDIPEGKDNLVYQVAENLASSLGRELPACEVKMTSDIPLARGLGSSAAAIVAAIEMTDQLTSASMTKQEKMRFASLWEGHPDNVGPCLYGGLIVGSHSEAETNMVHCGVPDIDLVIAVPDTELMTKKARGILPDHLEYHKAIKGSSVSNVLVAAMLKEDWDVVGKMMVEDVFHHPYREKLVPGLSDIMSNIRDYGAYGAALSGAGPTVMCLVPAGTGEDVVEKLEEDFPQFHVQTASPAPFGANVRYKKMSVKTL
ncbi:homoserine kinase [Alteribacillus persepolensis]|uniref:Homoserine kinase n=1 Tax=Alteribacillus persepolensis TaxID=568899 RepID=A0A1G8DY95_9BACI|nr:homoserine kinase [Alteribacillus persepolensis]SDH62548.1 homoserine kinase [Alteribacillus persepolensis]